MNKNKNNKKNKKSLTNLQKKEQYKKRKWFFLTISLIIFFIIHYVISLNSTFQDYNSYNTISKLEGNKSLFEHEYTKLDSILTNLISILNINALNIISLILLTLIPLIIFFILEEMKIEKIYIYLSYLLSLFMPISFHIDKIFSSISFEIFLFLLLILFYIKSLNRRKNIYYFIILLSFSLFLNPYFFILISTIFISYFLSQVFEIKTTKFQREISILVFILSIAIFTLFYYNRNIIFQNYEHSLKLIMIIPLSIIGLIYGITNTKDIRFNSHYIFIISNMLILLTLYIYNTNNLFLISLTYYTLIVVVGLFFNWFNNFLDFTKLSKLKNIITLTIFFLLITISTIVSIQNIKTENSEIYSYNELNLQMENLSINKYFLGDEKISSIYSYYYKRPVVNLISTIDSQFIKDYNSRKINTDKLYLLNKYNIDYIDDTFYYNDKTCLIPILEYTSENLNKTIYEIRCHIKGID